MEMNVKNLEEFWNKWCGSKHMISEKTLKRDVNMLGSIKSYKKKFLDFAKENLEKE